MKKWLPLALVLLMLVSCSEPQSTQEPESQGRWIDVYFENINGGAQIIEPSKYEISLENGLVVMAREALGYMQEQPLQSKLRPALPETVSIQSMRFEKNVLYIDFSEEYAELEGVDRTVAEACIAMTMSNFWNIKKVAISVNGVLAGEPIAVRDYAQEAPGAVSGQESVTVYLTDPTSGALAPCKLEVELDGETLPEEYAAQLLVQGIEGSRFTSPLPEGCTVESVNVSASVCYISFSKELLGITDSESALQTVQAITCTLTSIDYIDSVQILVDGAKAENFKAIDLSKEYSASNFNA